VKELRQEAGASCDGDAGQRPRILFAFGGPSLQSAPSTSKSCSLQSLQPHAGCAVGSNVAVTMLDIALRLKARFADWMDPVSAGGDAIESQKRSFSNKRQL
jgi:hypothetical protein